MSGKKHDKTTLNNTLLFILKLMKDYNIDNWFIAYGTLLGIVRENSCIQGDDDIDIIVDNKYYDLLKEVLLSNGFGIEHEYGIKESTKILKTEDRDGFASIDFYMADIDENGNFFDSWERVLWSNCYGDDGKLLEKSWEGETLYMPFNYEDKLVGRYGADWRKPKNSKGSNRRKVL